MPLFSFLLFVLVTYFTPGPNNIMAMALANQHGLQRTMTFCFGVGAGFFIIAFLCSLFHVMLTSVLPVIEFPLTLMGVGYMLYLAYKILTDKENNGGYRKENKNQFLLGFILQFVNPKGILTGITVVATFILPYYDSYVSYLLFSLFLGVAGVMSSFSWSLFGSIFQKLISRYRQPFNIIMAILLVYSAFSIFAH
ncbi:LysE family transporter [Paenibacillus thiaminolyticus]|uniref:LysE family transporter n=1 Tax=Paenibacillus thiaminolyticus TaxID=49283 RepID=UPI003D2D11E6